MNEKSRGTFCHPAAFIIKHPVRRPDRVFVKTYAGPDKSFRFSYRTLLHDIERTVFCFVINPSDIFADHSEH